jgi:isopenicillin-N epimerase
VTSLASHWLLDPNVTFLNHGSFGSCPRSVLDAQSEWRARLEREPVRFFARDLERLLDEVRGSVAAFVGAEPEGIAFVPNATTAANTVLGSVALEADDELLCTNHGYNAVNNVLARAAERSAARMVIATIPFPTASDDVVVEAVLAKVTPRTKLAVLDHVTSPTALVLPIARLVAELRARGVETLVDGAHGPGQLPLDLRALGAAYYTGNFHKWCCAPKGAAMLYARSDRRAGLRPAVTSHGANSTRTDRARFLIEFDWTGTADPSAVLCVPVALSSIAALAPGGWPEVMERNHALALEARRLLQRTLGLRPPCPDAMVGTMAALALPDAARAATPRSAGYADALQDALVERHQVQVPIIPWPSPPRRLVRVSAHLYNDIAQYGRLGEALRAELPELAAATP